MKKGLNYANLKAIALAAMLIDGFGLLFVNEIVERGWLPFSDDGKALYWVFRFIGRAAFVLFAFLIAEGFTKTSSRGGYVLRLSALAVMSELPFDLFTAGTGNLLKQNAVFTLLIGFVVLLGIDGVISCSKRPKGEKGHMWKGFSVILTVLMILAGMALAEALRTEFGGMGVALIAAFYLLKEKKVAMFITGALIYGVGIVPYTALDIGIRGVTSIWLRGIVKYSYTFADLVTELRAAVPSMVIYVIGAVAGMVPLLFYNGNKGYPASRIFYYLFYPLHMLLMYFVYVFMIIIIQGL